MNVQHTKASLWQFLKLSWRKGMIPRFVLYKRIPDSRSWTLRKDTVALVVSIGQYSGIYTEGYDLFTWKMRVHGPFRVAKRPDDLQGMDVSAPDKPFFKV